MTQNIPTGAEPLEELRRAVCTIGVVGTIDGHDVVRRNSVLDIIDRRRATLAPTGAAAEPTDKVQGLMRLADDMACAYAHRSVSEEVSARSAIETAIRAAIAHPAATAVCVPAARDVLAERRRQIEVEGWTPEHDDEHSHGQLADAAACYAIERAGILWPWDWSWWKPKDRRSNLVKAGALILAEIERLDRAASTAGATPETPETSGVSLRAGLSVPLRSTAIPDASGEERSVSPSPSDASGQ